MSGQCTDTVSGFLLVLLGKQTTTLILRKMLKREGRGIVFIFRCSLFSSPMFGLALLISKGSHCGTFNMRILNLSEMVGLMPVLAENNNGYEHTPLDSLIGGYSLKMLQEKRPTFALLLQSSGSVFQGKIGLWERSFDQILTISRGK